jgi:hypothetical protein
LQGYFLAHAGLSDGVRSRQTLVPSAKREKDGIRLQRPGQHLTRVGQVAILGTAVGNLAIQMATLKGDLATSCLGFGNPGTGLGNLQPSFGNPTLPRCQSREPRQAESALGACGRQDVSIDLENGPKNTQG